MLKMDLKILAKLIWKLVIIGDPAVGKTSIRRKYLGETTLKEYIYTIGADFATKRIRLSENLTVQYQIFDLAGQQKFDKVRSSFYSGSQAALLVYDITDNESLLNLPKWVQEVKRNSEGSIETFVVVGNKYDLKDKKKTDDNYLENFLKNLSKEMGHDILHINTSALTGENIDLLFNKITGKLLAEAGKDSPKIKSLTAELYKKKEVKSTEIKQVISPKKEKIAEISSIGLQKKVQIIDLEIENIKAEIKEIQSDIHTIKNNLLKYLHGMNKLIKEMDLRE